MKLYERLQQIELGGRIRLSAGEVERLLSAMNEPVRPYHRLLHRRVNIDAEKWKHNNHLLLGFDEHFVYTNRAIIPTHTVLNITEAKQ